MRVLLRSTLLLYWEGVLHGDVGAPSPVPDLLKPLAHFFLLLRRHSHQEIYPGEKLQVPRIYQKEVVDLPWRHMLNPEAKGRIKPGNPPGVFKWILRRFALGIL